MAGFYHGVRGTATRGTRLSGLQGVVHNRGNGQKGKERHVHNRIAAVAPYGYRRRGRCRGGACDPRAPRLSPPRPAPNAQIGTPASTITNPPRDWTRGHPSIYPDPDVLVIDPSFRALVPGNAPLQRLWTGAQWAEGPAWSSQGRYLVFSDVTGNTQYRYI